MTNRILMSASVRVVTTCGQVQEEFNLQELGIEATKSEEQILCSSTTNADNSVEPEEKQRIEPKQVKLDTSHLTLKASEQLTKRRSALMPTSDSNTGASIETKSSRKMSKPGINAEELRGEADEVYGLTANQIEAFREVFTLFDINGGGTIDASELDQALRSVEICLTEAELKDVLAVIDEDGNGEIDFDEFLNLMTSTEKFLSTLGDKRRSSYQSILFNALTRFMRKSALSSLSEIERYYHNKARKAPHVVAHYAAGARVIGLTEKQMAAHLASLPFKCAQGDSPYSQPVCKLPEDESKRKKKGKGKIRLRVKYPSSLKSTSSKGKKKNLRHQMHKDFANRIKLCRQRPARLDVKPLTKMPFVNASDIRSQTKSHLTIDDLPAIRTKVAQAQEEYKKRLTKCKEKLYKQNPHLFDIHRIPSRLLKLHYCQILDAYAISPGAIERSVSKKQRERMTGCPWRDLLKVRYGAMYLSC